MANTIDRKTGVWWRPGQTRDTKYTKVQRKKSGLKLRINLANGFRLPWSCFLKWELRRTYYGKKNILISKLLWPDFSILIKASVEKVMNYWARVTARALIMQLPTLIRIFLKLWQLFVPIYSTVQLFQGRKNDFFLPLSLTKTTAWTLDNFFGQLSTELEDNVLKKPWPIQSTFYPRFILPKRWVWLGPFALKFMACGNGER